MPSRPMAWMRLAYVSRYGKRPPQRRRRHNTSWSSEAQRIMSKTAFDLRNKKVLAFTTEKVQKIRVQYPSSQFTVERHGNAWKLIEPQKQDVPQGWKVDHMVYELSTLEYAKIVADSPDDGSRY